MESNAAMAPAVVTSDDKIHQVATTAQGYYDSDDVFNYYPHVNYRVYYNVTSRGIKESLEYKSKTIIRTSSVPQCKWATEGVFVHASGHISGNMGDENVRPCHRTTTCCGRVEQVTTSHKVLVREI